MFVTVSVLPDSFEIGLAVVRGTKGCPDPRELSWSCDPPNGHLCMGKPTSLGDSCDEYFPSGSEGRGGSGLRPRADWLEAEEQVREPSQQPLEHGWVGAPQAGSGLRYSAMSALAEGVGE